MAGLVTLALFVPLLLLSVAIEYPVIRLMNRAVDKTSVKDAIIPANVGSYLMMSTFLIARMIKVAIILSQKAMGTLIIALGLRLADEKH